MRVVIAEENHGLIREFYRRKFKCKQKTMRGRDHPRGRRAASKILQSALCVASLAPYSEPFKLNDKRFPLIMKRWTDNREIRKWCKSQLLQHTVCVSTKGSREIMNLINYYALMLSRSNLPHFITIFSIITFYLAFSRVRKNYFAS